MRLVFLLSVGGCSPEPCPSGSSRGASGLCVLDGTGPEGTDGSDGSGGTDGSDGADGTPGAGVGFLGGGTHSLDAVSLTVVVTEADGLHSPRDLAFNPHAPEQLWITDRHDDAMVIVRNPGTAQQSSWRSSGIDREHWLAQPVALAFGQEGYLATAHDDDGGARGGDNPSFLMGPTLWPSALEDFDGGRPSHLDMVHDPANMGGIAWERDNVYWVHDGHNQCLTRMDFAEPHEPGGTWHDDAVVDRYACGEVGYTADLPAHLVYDPEEGRVWIADPTLGHVAALDPTEWTRDRSVEGTDAAARSVMTGGGLQGTFTEGLEQPSGLALHEGLLLVSDPATSRLVALTRQGEVVDWLATGLPPGALGGIEVGPDGALWVVDRSAPQVLRIEAR